MVKDKYKIVCIEWQDSRQPASNWQLVSEMKDLEVAKCSSVGFLIHDDKKVKILAPNLADLSCEDTQAAGIIKIPTACVTKIIKLRPISS